MRKLLFLCTALLFAGEVYAQPKRLSLNDAIQAALENNADIALAEETTEQAKARAGEQRSMLLPNINAVVGHTSRTVNLGAMGIRFGGIPGLPSIPTRVGPFEVSDARLQYSEPVLDVSLIRRYRSLKQSADASESDTDAVRNRVVAMVASLYFGVQRARGIVDAANTQIELDDALLRLARDRRDAGVGTGLDVTRSESRLASDRHSLLQAQNDARTAQLRLLRAMGASLEASFDLADPLESASTRTESLPGAIELAIQNRPEMIAERKKVEAARLGRSASQAERLPTLQAFADYGGNGGPGAFVATDTIGVQLSLPIFDGGRRSAHARTAESQLRQAEVRAKNVRDEIELEVRIAFDTLASAQEQLAAAESALRLAQEELDLSRLRYEAQVTTQIDVLSAQAGLATARSRRVDALFAVKSAEVDYRRSLGER